jgi:acetyltransferase-like isoleucine patch superfamily enzyme
LRQQKEDQWDRILPFDELLFDRWEKAKYMRAAKGANLYHNCYIYGDVKIGKDTWIGPYTLLDGTGGLRIGNSCTLSSGVQIYTHDTVKRTLSGGKLKREIKNVTIKDCCYIGPYSVITKGVTIGQKSIIGAHSLVNSDVPPQSIVFGIPARVMGKIKIQNNTINIVYNK